MNFNICGDKNKSEKKEKSGEKTNAEEKRKEEEKSTKFKYRIITKTPIGKGGFSVVYQAVDRFDNIYAIKCIPLEKIKNNTEKFLLELDISMKMKHPNIVKSYDVFKTNKNWYIVCEYCDGGTLSDFIKSLKCDTMERELICKNYLTQLKNALKYLYRNNIVHRDLKPTNILISGKNPNEMLKLADFGFSRYFSAEDNDPLTQQNDFMMTSFCGTPMYMAPELLCNRKYTTKADLWSFGVIMYEMLYGTNPYNYPKSISNLLELMKTQKIVFKETYSNECLSLLKALLEIDVNKRINWESFFKHPWFDKKLKSGFSIDSLVGSSENLTSSCYPDQENDKRDDKSEIFDVNNVSAKDMIEKEIKKYNKHSEEEEDFDVIDKEDIGTHEVNTYKEEESRGILNILSNSIYTLFGGKTGSGKKLSF
jgi:serine/threonine-protein kinase ULK/ATG1